MRMLKPALTALAIALTAAPALAQVPRAPDGKPDLTGIWSNASLTPLSRAVSNARNKDPGALQGVGDVIELSC